MTSSWKPGTRRRRTSLSEGEPMLNIIGWVLLGIIAFDAVFLSVLYIINKAERRRRK